LLVKSFYKPIYIYSFRTRERCRFGRGCIFAHSPEELKEWEQEYDKKRKEKLRKELEDKEKTSSLEMASKILKGPAKDVSFFSFFFESLKRVQKGLKIKAGSELAR